MPLLGGVHMRTVTVLCGPLAGFHTKGQFCSRCKSIVHHTVYTHSGLPDALIIVLLPFNL